MTRTNSQIVLTSLAAFGLLAAGCDIFPTQPGGTPAVVRVLAVDQLALSTPPEVNTADSGGTWVLGSPGIGGVDASNINSPGPGLHASRYQLIDVQFNKVMDGDTIQTAPDDCTPVAGAITVTTTPAQPATGCGSANQSQIDCFTSNWFACYVPQSSDPSVGSQVLIFQLPDGAAYDSTNTPAGQGAGLLPGFTYDVTGTVKDYAGTALAIKASVTTQTAPMVVGTVDTANVNLAWNLTSDLATVDLERADDDGSGAPGTFATLAAGAATPYTDAGLTPGTPYWYRLALHPTTGTAVNSGLTNACTRAVADAAPTLVATATPDVTVTWNPSLAGVDTYRVQRSPDVTPRTYATIKSGIAATTGTYTDTTVVSTVPPTTYWYRVVSVAACGVTNNGAEASVTVP
jgi:hypothetical protein